jgi:hypothetical protein
VGDGASAKTQKAAENCRKAIADFNKKSSNYSVVLLQFFKTELQESFVGAALAAIIAAKAAPTNIVSPKATE